DAPEEDTSDQDDLAALMDALSDDAAETGETDEEDEAPDADNAPGSADSDALDDAPDEIGDDVSELMVALVVDDPDMAPVPQAETAPDEGTSMASMSAPTGSDEGATVEDFTGQEESNSGNIMDLSPMLSALSDLDDPADSPEAAQIDMPTDDDSEADAAAGTKDEDTPPPPEPVAPEDHTGDTDTPDYSEFEALMGAAAQQMAPEENTAPSEEPEVAQDPALETSEPQSPPDAQAAGTAPATAQPEASEEPDFSEFNALMAAADNGAGDIGGVDDGAHDAEIAPAPEAVTAQADRPEIDTDMGRSSEPAMPETLDATAGDNAQETAKPTAPLPESDAAVPTEDSTAVTGRSEVQQPDVVDEVPAPQTAAHVPEATEPQPTAAEPVAASFAEGKKKATLDDLYRLFPKREP
ncbi:hypothetical protein, partial [Thalassovita aquimarina]|uniref:hypothetical protein n=1 Tax=Thalassovita aquimarina TaxID=2785917 RepID=UPI00356152C3